jgi:hypothetical protein
MIDWKECLRYYARYIRWHYPFSDKQWCKWYQNNCRWYDD